MVYYSAFVRFLVFIYVIFRLLLAYDDFAAALTVMVSINVCHVIFAILLLVSPIAIAGFFCIVPVRLAIPTALYAIAYYYYTTTKIETSDALEIRERHEAE